MSAGRSDTTAHNFLISDTYKEGWDKTYGFKAAYWGALGIYFVINLLLHLPGELIIHFSAQNTAGLAVGNILSNVATLLLFPLVAGLVLMGVKRAVDLPVFSKMVFDYYKPFFFRVVGLMLLLILIYFLLMMITMGGFIVAFIAFVAQTTTVHIGGFLGTVGLLVGIVGLIFSLYVMVGYSLALPALIDKNTKILAAMSMSFRAVRAHWIKLLFAYLGLGVILVISAIPLGIGLIWTIPWVRCVMGVIYRDFLGVEKNTLS